ncbi:hypothetical protein FIBSPDRAFT_860177 [Athelia psychrophila]|uniref:FAR-17a/AIG1-like protein n=1 Tax=Athelia psychrophila TaxID=1759441 RepID=A0A166KDE1_9AGAM|nr:hypothetical protein FIBSPDRAFT_860177 [Fibularhizoctonia sp. CBS 109695]
MAATSKLYARLGVPSNISPALVTSPVLSPLGLACARILLALYALTTSIVVLVHDTQGSKDASGFFSYFTDLSYIGLISYLCASAVQTLVYALRRNGSFPLQRWPRLLQFLHILLYSTVTTFPIIVTVVFWALLSSPSTFATTFSGWSNISQHAMNTLFALFEILLTNVRPAPWAHVVFLEVFLVCYLGVAYITKATDGFYTYSFLDPHTEHGLLAAYIAGIGIGGALVFAAVKGLVTLRVRFFQKRGRAGADWEVQCEWEADRLGQDEEGKEGDAWEEGERPGEGSAVV